MGINIRTKGAQGEREIAKMFNGWVAECRENSNLQPLETRDELFQRNQNQSAVGGDDLTNPLGLSIEVKRQEALSVGSWWAQCIASAERTGGIPILIYKQNRKKWNVVLYAKIPAGESLVDVTCTITILELKKWFKTYFMFKVYQANL